MHAFQAEAECAETGLPCTMNLHGVMLVFCIVDGAGEFLDAWLLLMEKLTNPKNILESAYVFGVKSSEPAVFSPLQYLVQIQKVQIPFSSYCNTSESFCRCFELAWR